MKRIITIAAAILALSLSAFGDNMVKKTIDLGEFNGISAGFIHEIHVSKGKSNAIEISCPDRYTDYLDYKIVNGTLHLKHGLPNGKRFRGSTSDDKIIVRLQMEEINEIVLSGAAELTATGDFDSSSGNLIIDLSGASEIKDVLHTRAKYLKCDLNGASQCTVEGRFTKVTSQLSGAAELDLNGDSDELVIEASGAAECRYEGMAGTIGVECSGAADVEMKGTAKDIAIECSGGCQVDAEDMIADNVTASANGASSIKVYGNKKMKLSASIASSIKYFGPAKELEIANTSIKRGR